MKVIEKKYLLPFVLVTSLFALWGLANNMTDTLLAAFKKIMQMSDTQTSFIQMAFYGAYFCVALPAALFIRKYSYKKGVILGLLLYAGGAIQSGINLSRLAAEMARVNATDNRQRVRMLLVAEIFRQLKKLSRC